MLNTFGCNFDMKKVLSVHLNFSTGLLSLIRENEVVQLIPRHTFVAS